MLAVFACLSLSTVFVMEHEEKSFVSWMRGTNQYFTGNEYHIRLGVWLTNMRFVREHNAKGAFTVEMNHLSALTPAEYRSLLGLRVSAKKQVAVRSNYRREATVDWRAKGAVTGAWDQGSCGSCWAFATIAAAEGANFIASGKLIALSESNLVDCVTECDGCDGGLMTAAFDYVIASQDGMFMSNKDYPYVPTQKTCAFNATAAISHVSKYLVIVEGDEDDLADKCAEHGPTSIGIDAGHRSFQLYKSGIYEEEECSSTDLDHGVTLVGYGTEGEQDYWMIKNSWGGKWGEYGYIRMLRQDNMCGVATTACVPIA